MAGGLRGGARFGNYSSQIEITHDAARAPPTAFASTSAIGWKRGGGKRGNVAGVEPGFLAESGYSFSSVPASTPPPIELQYSFFGGQTLRDMEKDTNSEIEEEGEEEEEGGVGGGFLHEYGFGDDDVDHEDDDDAIHSEFVFILSYLLVVQLISFLIDFFFFHPAEISQLILLNQVMKMMTIMT